MWVCVLRREIGQAVHLIYTQGAENAKSITRNPLRQKKFLPMKLGLRGLRAERFHHFFRAAGGALARGEAHEEGVAERIGFGAGERE